MVTRLSHLFLMLCVLLLASPALAHEVQRPHGHTSGEFTVPLQASPQGSQFSTVQTALEAYRAGQFETLAANLGRGYRKDEVWLGFDLDMRELQDALYILEVAPAFLDRISAYLVSEEGAIRTLGQAGDQVPQNQTRLASFKPAFVLPRLNSGRYTVMLHIQTSSTQAAIVSMYRMESFVAQSAMEGMVLGTVFAIGLFIALMTLGLYALERHPTYLFWLGYVGTTTALWFCIDGVAYRFIHFDNLAVLNVATSVLGALSLAFAMLLLTHLFNFKRSSVLLHRFLVYWAWMLILVTFTGLILDTLFVPGQLYLLSTPLLVLGAILIAVQALRGNRQSQLYGLPFIGFIGFSLYNLMANLGWATYSFGSLYGWQIAGVLNLISLQLAFLDQARKKDALYKTEHNYFLKLLAQKNTELEERVTARTQDLQEALEQVRRSESEQRQLLSMASHEFRTPAAVIKASLDSLKFLQSKIPPEVSQRLDNMRLASQRLVGLANDLINQDRLQNRALDPTNKQRIDLCKLAQETCSLYTDGTWLTLHAPSSPLWIDADPALLKIALHNLILNAQRHAQGEERGVSVKLSDADGHALLQVIDHGPGVPAANKTRIFERFFSGDSANASPHGSGLGLSIVQNIARSHGGNTLVEDNLPCGSIFTISLPSKARASPQNS